MDNTQIITTTGDKLREVIAAKFAEILSGIDAGETVAKLPHVVTLKQAEGALAQLDLDDDTLEAAYDNNLSAADIRATISATYPSQKATAEAAIARIVDEANARRAKLQAVGEDVGATSADELMTLVEVDGSVTIASVQAGLAAWIAAQIQQERDGIDAAQTLHTNNIAVFANLSLRLNDMSNDDIFNALNVE